MSYKIENNILERMYDDNIPSYYLYTQYNGVFPNVRVYSNCKYKTSMLDVMKSNYELLFTKQNYTKSKDITYYLFKNYDGVLIDITVITNIITHIKIYENNHNKLPDNFLDSFETISTISDVHLLVQHNGYLDTEEFELDVKDVDVELNYGKQFLSIDKHIREKLSKDKTSGIILLHGIPGSGKTTYIKSLCRFLKKEVIFIPPNFASSLSDPGFIPFLMNHKNSILVIEDAEKVIADRESNNSSVGVSNILNLTDGILGDCLSINIIATFNMPREKIDSALLRKGRLIAEYKFDKLSVEDSNKLIKHIGFDFVTKEPMTLSDIYNLKEENFKINSKQTKIGLV